MHSSPEVESMRSSGAAEGSRMENLSESDWSQSTSEAETYKIILFWFDFFLRLAIKLQTQSMKKKESLGATDCAKVWRNYIFFLRVGQTNDSF